MGLLFTVAIALIGGIRSPGLTMYGALPISAAWLFGYRGTSLTVAVCIGGVLAFALWAAAGKEQYFIFPGHLFGIMTMVVGAILVAAVAAAQIVKNLQQALRQSDASLRLATETAGVGNA